MTKKCMGCGVTLQDQEINKAGYTKDLSMSLCMRCFKLKNYNELINSGVEINNNELIKKINSKKSFVIFLVDFLNICNEVIDTYKSIKNDKVLVITKSDLIYKNIIKEDLINNIKDIYDIKENILLVNTKDKENLSRITNICLEKQNVIITGFTNAGKSSLINALIGSSITVSNKSNTTQDFIKLNVDGITIYDTPGFISENVLENKYAKNDLVPVIYQMDSKYYLEFSYINLYFKENGNITMYLNKQEIRKLKVKEDITCNILIPSNSDLVIKGIGFIRFKKANFVSLNLPPKFYEIRPTIIGGNHE